MRSFGYINNWEDDVRQSPAFDNNFSDFYNDNGKQAGTYVFNDGQWSMK
ncbi:MAG: hypothetical protein LBH44_09130 [Treponema sp.]|nr:hypothetical protein [Treponema sp.]